MKTDWTSEWTPPARDQPELDAKTLAAVRALQAGETEASTGHLFATFEPELAAYFRRHGCKADEADDLTQNVFIQMLEEIGTLKEAASFHFWLFRIAVNIFRRFVRDRVSSREGFEDFKDHASQEGESAAFWAHGTFEPNPEAQLTVNETVDQRRLVLRKLLQATRLKPKTRQSLVLRLQGASNEEIARALEIPVGTVKSHLSRASAALLKNHDEIDLDSISLEDSDDLIADLAPELLTFRREALEADPAYSRATALEVASIGDEEADERDEKAMLALAKQVRRHQRKRVRRVAYHSSAIAAVARQDRKRGRARRRLRRTVPPAGHKDQELALGRLDKDGLGYPLILLDEAAGLAEGRVSVPLGGSKEVNGSTEGDLALKAKLTCAGALLVRGRRFRTARRVAEIVRQAIELIGEGRRDGIRSKVREGRGLLRSYLVRVTGSSGT